MNVPLLILTLIHVITFSIAAPNPPPTPIIDVAVPDMGGDDQLYGCEVQFTNQEPRPEVLEELTEEVIEDVNLDECALTCIVSGPECVAFFHIDTSGCFLLNGDLTDDDMDPSEEETIAAHC